MSLPAFSSNYTTDGKLFRRKHGYKFTVDANELKQFEIIVPYAKCKIDSVEIIGCHKSDTSNFKILDDDLGTITTIPKQQINQYGFDVNMTDDFYKDQSRYEADLFAGLYIKIEYQENMGLQKEISVNIDFHEVV